MTEESRTERGDAAEPAPAADFPTISVKSEDSTEQLICKTPQKSKGLSVSSKSAEAGSSGGRPRRRLVVLGAAQALLGAALVSGGALGVVKGAALARVGAGLWAGGAALAAGVVGVLAGVHECYGLDGSTSGGLATAFLALSLVSLACGNSVAVLAATGLQRDASREPSPLLTFQDEMQAWTPVLANIALLIISSVHCIVCVVSIYHLSRRLCSCFRPKQSYEHNQFDPAFKNQHSCVFHVDEVKKAQDVERLKGHELCKELEAKLQGDTMRKKKEQEFGSANSREHLVSRWLGHTGPAPPRTGPRKTRKHPAPAVLLVPAHPHSTLGRMPMSVVMPPRPLPRPYATLPLPPQPPPIYYPLHDPRVRRRRSPREKRRAGRVRPRRERERQRERDTQLTRSLERIHRKRRAERERLSEAELKRTYTGLDRAYAEQFIAVCDESRHYHELLDSLATTTTLATTDSCDSHHSH
ncbi:uncharacterized protein LOC126969635 [Leptidea sinapis]|uniref:uncharacterized protein LOC126969635 n=1 Tax=Leptidea sinapis TaxID=189913 RepID=UPI002123226B|nr:uncharacterized protein LOC126969635 [Leptidea sinapis]